MFPSLLLSLFLTSSASFHLFSMLCLLNSALYFHQIQLCDTIDAQCLCFIPVNIGWAALKIFFGSSFRTNQWIYVPAYKAPVIVALNRYSALNIFGNTQRLGQRTYCTYMQQNVYKIIQIKFDVCYAVRLCIRRLVPTYLQVVTYAPILQNHFLDSRPTDQLLQPS